MNDLLVKNVRAIEEGKPFNVTCANGRIEELGSSDSPATQVIDADGMVIVPPFVETHIHLDTALTFGKIENHSGTLLEGIQLWNEYQQSMTEEDVIDRAKKVIYEMASKGVLHFRVMVDVSSPELTGLKALVKVKEEVSNIAELQLIAFPQNGLMSSERGVDLLKQAFSYGVDGVSAVPHLEHTREKGLESLNLCFELAEQHQTFVHIFCDETDDPDSKFIETVASLAIDTGLHDRVTVSHANAMNYYQEAYVSKLLNTIAQSKMNVVTCPLINSVMQGKQAPYPKGRGITRVKDLHAKGINVACAHDDFMSPFYPLGNGSMLTAVHMLLHLAHMTGTKDFQVGLNMITYHAAKVLGLKKYGLNTGDHANFLLFEATNTHDLIRRGVSPRYVIRNGQLLAETVPEKTKMFHERYCST
ncbi:cytosine deaminase [Salipaludibacillus keqinensis]|uniref:Cytosine deaminase n=1 Tax=Salipaludibacillus keqinensis TaxID=2045207 RepID=A0A323TIL6_9BACI|nr:amidohydrolase family protein [Salipaludibacillus keqinensis]PYZ94751.1 cytosine deaminase [Salipaludibacillus keqinensis]